MPETVFLWPVFWHTLTSVTGVTSVTALFTEPDINSLHENKKAFSPFYQKKIFERKWLQGTLWMHPIFIFYQKYFLL